jgi:hypothetical protein
MSQQLPPTREASNGNSINRSSRFVFARRRRLGIFPLAQELAPSICQQLETETHRQSVLVLLKSAESRGKSTQQSAIHHSLEITYRIQQRRKTYE